MKKDDTDIMQQFCVRVPKSTVSFLRAKAAEKTCREVDIIRDALNEYLFKEIDTQNLIVAAMQDLKRKNEKLELKVDVLTRMFLHWLKFYFMFVPPLPQDPKEKQIVIKQGAQRQEGFINQFKTDLKSTPSLIETILMDYLEG